MLKLKEQFNLIQTDREKEHHIIFIHGNSHCHKTFNREQLEQILPDHNIITYDLLGHGDALRVDDYAVDSFTYQIEEIIDELKLDNYSIVGASLGGHLAIQALTQLKTHPKQLFLMGMAPLEHPLTLSVFADLPELGYLLQEHISQEQATELRDKFIKTEQNRLPFQVESILNTDPHFRKTFLPSVLQGNYKDEFSILNSYSGEYFLYLGEEDEFINPQYCKEKLSSFPLKYVSNTSHNIHQDNPKEFYKILKEFFLKT